MVCVILRDSVQSGLKRKTFPINIFEKYIPRYKSVGREGEKTIGKMEFKIA